MGGGREDSDGVALKNCFRPRPSSSRNGMAIFKNFFSVFGQISRTIFWKVEGSRPPICSLELATVIMIFAVANFLTI